MKCPKIEELARYLDGELPERSRLALRDHLLSCPECRGCLKSLRRTNSILRSYLPSPLTPGPACPDEETILAYAESSLTDQDQQRISAHLAGCDYCAVRAAGALETIRLRDELEEKGLEPVPSHLTQRALKIFSTKKPISLGRVVAVLADLRERIQRSFEYRLPAPAFSVVREPAALYETERSQTEETLPPDRELAGGKLLSGRVTIEIRPAGIGKAKLRVSLTDELDRPRSGIELQLQTGGNTLQTHKTGPRGEADFREIETGRYRLIIPHRQGVFLDILIN